MDQMKKQAVEQIDSLKQELNTICCAIHENPELGFHEYEASKRLTEFLEEKGFSVERGVAGLETAFRAERSGKAEGPVLGILCEYDALPGIGHGCGHNVIATSSVGAAIGAAAVLEDFAGKIVVLGTPSEEGSGGGKQLMWDAGVMKDIDCAIMFHPGPETVVRDKTLAIQALRFTFHGRSAHGGAAQEYGRNAVEAVVQLFNGINSLRGHLKKDVNIHGIITKGGEASNIIPDLGEAEFGVRAATLSELQEVVERVSDCARGAALMTGCTVDITSLGMPYADMVTNETLLSLMEKNLELLEIPIDVHEAPLALASTDVGNLSHFIPAIQCMIGVGEPVLPHTPAFTGAVAGEKGTEIALKAAKTMACTLIDLLKEPSLIEEAKKEQKERTKGE